MRRWMGAAAALMSLLAGVTSAQSAGSLGGTWKGTLRVLSASEGSPSVNVQLRISQRALGLFFGTGISCDSSPVPGCPQGSSDDTIAFRGSFLGTTGPASPFSVQFDVPQKGACVAFVSAEGMLSGDGRALNLLMRGLDPECNPILFLINASRD